MGMMQSAAPQMRTIMEQGHYRFVAMFTWTGLEDKVAVERLKPYIGLCLMNWDFIFLLELYLRMAPLAT